MINSATLFENITVLTPDDHGKIKIIDNGYVAVNNHRIVCVTTNQEEAKAALPNQYLSYSGKDKLLLPTFANAHCHLAMTLMRNSADDMVLQDWLFNNIFPREAKLTPDLIVKGTELAYVELIRGGTTCVADMYFAPHEVAASATQAGLRLNICCESTVSRGVNETRVMWDEVKSFVDQWHDSQEGRIRASLLVHSIYLYSESAYRELANLAKAAGVGIQIHVSETKKEVDDCLAQYGMRPPAKLAAEGIFDVPTVAAHCVWLNDEDRDVLARYGVHVAHNPISNLKLGSGIADVESMQRAGIPVALGTDGAASNNRLDMFSEMRTAALLAKGVSCDPTAVSAETALNMATVNGYRALGFVEGGLIQTGAIADLQILRLSDANLNPPANPTAAVVYSAGRENVESVMCDGQFLLYKGDLTTLDEAKIRYEAESASKLIQL
ncbi:MAG: amidohydrolase [Fastidiosipilaceae bacterium]|nr:amidohydrolase [Clostridiaceae bacterium]